MAGSDQWKKTYELNEEAWRKWYREQNRARKNRPLPLLLFVFSTVIQFPLILLYVVRTQMRAGEAAVLLLLSASLGLLACFNRYASKTYAHFRLKQPGPIQTIWNLSDSNSERKRMDLQAGKNG